MNRRSFITAIPAAVAALTASRGIAGATSPVDASAAIVGDSEALIDLLNAYTDGLDSWSASLNELAESIESLVDATGTVVPRGRNGQRMVEEVHYCEHCDADTFPTGPRISDDHAIVRRGYHDMGAVWLDGERLSDACIEAFAGEHGWVIVETYRPGTSTFTVPREHMCPNCFGNMLEVKYGVDEIERWNGITEWRPSVPAFTIIPPANATMIRIKGVE